MTTIEHREAGATAASTRSDAVQFRREVLGILGVVLASVAMVGGSSAAEVPTVAVTVTATACEPMDLKVPAGKVTFVVTNRSARALEWEILKGVVVVDERENIAPGFRAKLTTTLEPGTYDVTCGLLDNPRGRLVVTGTAAAIGLADLAGPIAEYRVGNARIVADLEAALGRLEAAGGDRGAARSAFVEARAQITALAPLRPDLGPLPAALDAEIAEIDRLLFTAEGADVASRLPDFLRDARAFAVAARPVVASADRLVGSAVASARDLPARLAAPTSPSALVEAEAERVAIERVLALFAPLWARSDPASAAAATAALEALKVELAVPGPIAGHADALSLTPEQRRSQIAAARALAERIAGLPAGLGL